MMSAKSRHSVAIRLAAFIAGYCTFINLYSPQAILPMLSVQFGVGPAQIATIMTASTLAVALIAPFSGTVADVLGRKRVIVIAMIVLAIPTIMSALAPNLHAMVFWRFVQGLAMPPVFAVIIAYLGEELPPHEATAAAGVYTSGASIGGFSGRMLTGVFADLFGWRYGIIFLACLTLAGAMVILTMLPRERKFVPPEGLLASAKQMLGHLRNRQLLATFAVGFGVLFNFIVTFTYISFLLAAPPYALSASWLGAIFVVYLSGSALTPMTGYAVSRFGRRNIMLVAIGLWIVGIGLTLLAPLAAIVLGLVFAAACGLLCQSISTGYVTVTAQAGKSSAVGLYVSSFYLGGSFGAAIGGLAWTYGGWPLCAAVVGLMLAIMATIVAVFWTPTNRPSPTPAMEPA